MLGFKKIQFPNGTFSLQDLENDQVMHSAIGPETEAIEVYAKPAGAWLKQQTLHKPLVLFDIGLGTGRNVTEFIKSLDQQNRALQIYSFETKPAGLKFAVETGLTPGFESPLTELYQKHHCVFEWQKLKVDWRLLAGPVQKTLQEITDSAQLIFFDLYSPRHEPENWNEEFFKNLYQQMSRPGLLITYAAAGWVKRNLKNAGFEVHAGPGTPLKRETTHAIK